MTRKTIFTVFIVGLLTFLIGWFLHDILRPNQIKDVSKIYSSIDSMPGYDTLGIKKVTDYSNSISGRFIMAESNCAGFNFINKTTILWINEIACDDPDTLNVTWLDNATFMTKSTQRINENCPPRVDIYHVISSDSKHLILNSIWTGWNNSKDEILEFTKQDN